MSLSSSTLLIWSLLALQRPNLHQPNADLRLQNGSSQIYGWDRSNSIHHVFSVSCISETKIYCLCELTSLKFPISVMSYIMFMCSVGALCGYPYFFKARSNLYILQLKFIILWNMLFFPQVRWENQYLMFVQPTNRFSRMGQAARPVITGLQSNETCMSFHAFHFKGSVFQRMWGTALLLVLICIH